MVKVANIRVQYDKKVVIDDLSLDIPKQGITTIIGPNGCGKSTLLKAMSKNLPYTKGHITIEGKGLKKIRTKELAKIMALLPQAPKVPSDISVGELVSFGRYPFVPFGRRFRQEDYDMVTWALEKTDMLSMRCRKVNNLSGGERQRAWIAMALARKPKILLLDEPTTHLDIAHQFDTLAFVRDLSKKMDMTIVMVLHDINQAARYSDEIVLMKAGQKVAQGKPERVLGKESMGHVFGLEGDYFMHGKYPHFIPVGRYPSEEQAKGQEPQSIIEGKERP